MIDVLPEFLERNRRVAIGVVNEIGPRLEFGIVCHAAFERDRLEFPDARRHARRAGIAAFAMRDRLGGALERADLADAGDVSGRPT